MALDLVQKTHQRHRYKVYCDGSSYKGGVGAAAVLYKHNRIVKTSRFYLGSPNEHMVYEAELVGILLVLHLLHTLLPAYQYYDNKPQQPRHNSCTKQPKA